jgi:hypothetical protein
MDLVPHGKQRAKSVCIRARPADMVAGYRTWRISAEKRRKCEYVVHYYCSRCRARPVPCRDASNMVQEPGTTCRCARGAADDPYGIWLQARLTAIAMQ